MLLDFVWLLYFNEAIKPKPSNAKKPRNTAAKQILQLAASADEDAEFEAKHIAIYGRVLSDYERSLLNLRHSNRRFKMNPKERIYLVGQSAPAPSLEMTPEERSYRYWEKTVCDVFIKAVLKGDRETIIKLADAAAFINSKLGPDSDFMPDDPVRLKLLEIKNQPRLYPKRFTMRQIAEQVYSKTAIKDHASGGFSALRRLCKELKVPIRPSRKTKQK